LFVDIASYAFVCCFTQAKYHDYLQGQIGNPDGAEKPNKKYYDPRMSLRAAEEAMAKRLVKAAEDLKCIKVI
jgi:fructose-bisphosphate aldolase class II